MKHDWAHVVAEHGPVVWQTAYRLLGNEADTADCYQDTFLCAVRLARREPVRSWDALLQRIATARALERLRKRIRDRGRRIVAADFSAVPGREHGPSENAEEVELANRLRSAVAELPAEQAEVFCLRCLEGWEYIDIAAEMGISMNKTRVLLHRARAALRKLLKSELVV